MKHCICTIAIGKMATEIAPISIPLMKLYAKSVHADFVVLKSTEFSEKFFKANYEKLQIGNLLSSYERVLYLDVDILVMPDTRNVFDMVQPTCLGVTVVGNKLSKINIEWKAMKRIFDFEIERESYFNSGVILSSRQHAELFDPGRIDVKVWSKMKKNGQLNGHNDQSVFNYRVQKSEIPIQDLGKQYNFTRVWGNYHDRFQQSFIHYAGIGKSRMELMRRDAALAGFRPGLTACRLFPRLSMIRDQYLMSRKILPEPRKK